MIEAKTNKKILVVSPFFSPEIISTGKFNTDMVVALRDQGFKVTMLCSHPLYPNWKPQKSNQIIDGITILRGGGYVHYTKHPIIRRAILELWFSFYTFYKLLVLKDKFDIVIPVFPPSLFFCFLPIILNKSTKKVGIVHDLQEVYSNKKKGLLSKLIGKVINKVEKKAFKSCDKLIFLSKEMLNTALKYYELERNKLEVQYPFYTIDDLKSTNDLESILPSGINHIVYSGALGSKQNPNGLLRLFEYASTKVFNCQFHFFSQGDSFEHLEKKNINNKINFHSLVPRENIEELYNRSTIQIIPQLSGTSKGSLPSKLPNIMVSGCDLLLITDKNSEIAELFLDYNIGKVLYSWDKDLFLRAIEERLLKPNIDKKQQVKSGKKLFGIDSMIRKLVNE